MRKNNNTEPKKNNDNRNNRNAGRRDNRGGANQSAQGNQQNNRHARKGKSDGRKLKIIPIGGLDAIGRNMTVYEYEDTIIAVDCGIMFPTNDMPGIDFIIPDFTYLRNNRSKFKGIFITHGHEDHIGAVSFLLQEFDVPVFGTRLTLGLIKNRLKERTLKYQPRLIEVEPREQTKIGPFDVSFIRVVHSIVDSVALAIRTPAGVVVHTGDFKFDHSPVDGKVADIYTLAELGESGVDLLLSDSTNAERPGYTGSESELNSKLMDLFSNAKGRIIVATFASNINRIQQVLDAAAKFNRKVVISGRSMINNIEIARELGYLTYKDGLILELNEAKSMQDKKMVLICTGTQGEPMSALSRIANGTHNHFRCHPGDKVIITASVIPGNENSVGVVINQLLKYGTTVFYENDDRIHVSGHASQEELKLMISLVKPRCFMPIHGEHRHLKAHARLAENLGIKPNNIIVADNGDIVTFSKDAIEKSGRMDIRNVFVDGQLMDDLSSDIIKDRQIMSEDGIVMATIVMNEGFMASEPVITMKGFVGCGSENIRKMIHETIDEKLARVNNGQASRTEIISSVKRALRTMFEKNLQRDPIVEVQVVEI